jgi:hypothetical protein
MQGEDVENVFVPVDDDLRVEKSAQNETDSRPFAILNSVTSQP